jgi:DNA-binding MarR family transcriptional regulator
MAPRTKPAASSSREQRASRTLATFRQVVAAAKRHFVEARDKCDLSGAQLWTLSQIADAPGCTVQELAASMSVHQSTASNLIEKLTAARLVRKKRETSDKRVVRLFATAAGSQMLKKAPMPARGAIPEALNRMTDEELRALEESLLMLARKIGASADAQPQASRPPAVTPASVPRPARVRD